MKFDTGGLYKSCYEVNSGSCLNTVMLPLHEAEEFYQSSKSGCWSYLHCSQGHSIILMWFQKSDPIFSMGVKVMRSPCNFEPKYRVTMLTRGEWTRGPRTSPVISDLSGIQIGPGQ